MSGSKLRLTIFGHIFNTEAKCMRQFFLFIPTLLLAISVAAQAPVNDDCSGLVDLGTAPACAGTVYTNVQATHSDIGFDNSPSCFQNNLATRDVWFSFTCPINMIEFRVSVIGTGTNPISNPQFAIYRGDCAFDNLAEFACVKSDPGSNEVFLDLTGLTPTLQYFVRVSDFTLTGNPNAGEFTICVDTIPAITTITGGSSSLCNGTIYDSGGATGDYGPDEDYVFKICPATPSSCIEFTLDYYNIEQADFFQGGETLTFYDGPDTNSPVLANISGTDFNGVSAGGAVCFQVNATSGCLTLQFQSDESVELDGFKGHWKCSDKPCALITPLAVNSNINANQLAQALTNPSNTVTVTSVNCAAGSYGSYSYATDDNDLGIKKGVLLTSGDAQLAVGPNLDEGAGFGNGATGDADLDYLSTAFGNGTTSENACVVELDVFVRSDELTFEYVFGSDEYTEFVDDDYNDIFAFLISGPGIVGDPSLGGAQNIAVLPDGNNTLVQINSVNNLTNWDYYRNNEIGQSIGYDGLTSDKKGIKKSLTARSKVTPCQTYHLKFAIADRGDDIYDSGVFIAEIQSGAPDITVQFATGINYFTENCSGVADNLIITLSEASTDTIRYTTTIAGTATLGIDYLLTIPQVITFLPGQTQLSFPIVPIGDNTPEPTETIEIGLTNDFGCGPVTYKSIVIEIKDNVEVNVIGGDTLFVCQGGTLQLQAEGAIDYLWQPTAAVSNPFLPNPTITPTANIWLQVTGTLGTCVDVDSVFIAIVNPAIDITTVGPIGICQGTSVQLASINNVNNTGLSWSPSIGLSDPNSPNPVASPSESTLYTVSVNIAGCSVSDTIRINVDTLFLPVIIQDTLVCQNYSVILGSTVNESTFYVWSPSVGLSATNISNPIATPNISTSYQLISTSANNYCKDTSIVEVNIIPADVSIAGPDTVFICLGSTVSLNASANPAGSTITWAPSFYVSPVTGPAVVVNPDESVTVRAFYNINGCNVTDSVYIRVDSLPSNMITASPVKPFYCPGDTVYLTSQTYEPAQFPDIQLNWPAVGGEQTPDSLWNMVLIVAESGTFTYTRYIENNACFDTSTVLVTVATPVEFTITGDLDICLGESTQLTVSSVPPNVAVEWKDPTVGLSCNNCTNPVANPTTTSTYTVSAKDAQCPSPASVTITVNTAPAIVWPDPPSVCLGDSVLLNNAMDQGQTYNWSGPGIANPSVKYPKVAPTSNATYTVTVTSVLGCKNIETKTINVLSASINAGTNQTVCRGSTAQLQASATGTPGVITWQPGGLVGASPTSGPIDVNTVFTATLVFGGNLGCTVSDTATVFVQQPATFNISGDNDICKGQVSQLIATSTPPGLTLEWQAPTTGLSCTNCPNPVASPTETTTYTVSAKDEACATPNSFTITVNTAPAIVWPDPLGVCLGDTISLNSAVDQGQTYNWTGPGISAPTIKNPKVHPTADATYSVTVTGANGCTNVETNTIKVFTATINAGANQTVCNGTQAQLTATTTGAVDVINWTPSNPAAQGTTFTTPNISGPTTFTATASFGGSLGCQVSDQVNVGIFPISSMSAIMVLDTTILPAQIICYGTPVRFRVTTIPQNLPIQWTVNGITIDETTQTLTYYPRPMGRDTNPTPFQLGASIVDANGCTSSVDPFNLSVKRCYDIPNAFTPNNSGGNDTFGVINTDSTSIPVEQFYIFNRWGQRIWEATPTMQKWDGKIGGKDAPIDTYFYHVVIRFPDDSIDQLQGEVTLLR